MSWIPGAKPEALKARAEAYRSIRAFFEQRDVLEVETPILGSSTATDPHLASMQLEEQSQLPHGQCRYLHTSPEFPMKRLLASGSGDIYQICKTFRAAELGGRHNPEFTMLEWYRAGFSLEALMQEVLALVNLVLGRELSFELLDYRETFLAHLHIDPFSVSLEQLKALCLERADFQAGAGMSRDDYLDLLLSALIEPTLGRGKATFLVGYPASQAALAQIQSSPAGHQVAQRFELYLEGLEIANGYRELQDAREQRQRFDADNQQREAEGKPQIPLDEHLLAALEHGIPACAGVALGIDRLLMISTGAPDIDAVLAFSWARA